MIVQMEKKCVTMLTYTMKAIFMSIVLNNVKHKHSELLSVPNILSMYFCTYSGNDHFTVINLPNWSINFVPDAYRKPLSKG